MFCRLLLSTEGGGGGERGRRKKAAPSRKDWGPAPLGGRPPPPFATTLAPLPADKGRNRKADPSPPFAPILCSPLTACQCDRVRDDRKKTTASRRRPADGHCNPSPRTPASAKAGCKVPDEIPRLGPRTRHTDVP